MILEDTKKTVLFNKIKSNINGPRPWFQNKKKRRTGEKKSDPEEEEESFSEIV